MVFGKEPVRLGMQLAFGGVRRKSRISLIGKYFAQETSGFLWYR